MMTVGVWILLGALTSCYGFNLDVESPVVFQEDAAGFGQSMVQFGRSRIIVGAPLEVVATNQTGRLYSCDVAQHRCQPISLLMSPEVVNASLGLSLAASASHSHLLVCGPRVHKVCGENMHLEGSCLLLDHELQFLRTFPTALSECPIQEMDIAFLVDGSGSIRGNDFEQMKTFVRAMMGQFQGTNTQFALMQYSNLLKTHFTFAQFRSSPQPLSLVDPIVQLKGLTFTATGIQTAVRQLFHRDKGARPSAKKILVVITDGQKYKDSLEYSDVIPEAEREGVTRFAIGVGEAFLEAEARRELSVIGSQPEHHHVLKVDNFAALGSIQKRLQERIFAVEGTQLTAASAFHHEMSQEGFSATLTTDGPVLGAVGSFSWSGGAFLYRPNMSHTFINMSKASEDMQDAYLGYSTEVVLWKGTQSLVLGAPRYEHVGKVVLFTPSHGQWKPKAEVTGTQIGSYFGASLCSVDVDRDGSADLVLVGTPHYYEQTRGGQVSLCPLPKGRARWRCEGAVLRGVQGHPWARFGAALTVLGDVNGDKLMDVAVGAPGEEENRGAVYLFHGTSDIGLGISLAHSQRVAAAQLSPSLQLFGQVLSGGQDLTGDGLLDLAVGAHGHALLLRSRPVLKVDVATQFSPAEVPKAAYQCWEQGPGNLVAGTATICLIIHKSSVDQLGDVQSFVRYDLVLDPGRLIPRAIFAETKNWTLTRRRTLKLGKHCDTLKLLLPDCVEDVVSPVVLRLNFSLEGEPIPSFQNLRPVMAKDSEDFFTVPFPFEKNCGQDRLCEGDLGVHLSYSGPQTLLVGSILEFNVTVTVWNEGEDSYGTAVSFYYPEGLSYRRVLGTQRARQRPLRLSCEAAPAGAEHLRSSRCTINHPVFREASEGTFTVTFDVSSKATLGDRLLVTANASSENNKPPTSKTTSRLELQVKYAVYTVISRQEESTKYLNFSSSDITSRREIEHRYRVNNLSQRDLAISVLFWVPTLLGGATVWDVAVTAPSQSLPCVSERAPPQHADFQTQIPGSPILDCRVAHCLKFSCAVPSFGLQEELDFTLKGNLSFGWVHQSLQTQLKKVAMLSVAKILLNTSVYSQLLGQEAFLQAQVETVLEKVEVYNPIPLVVGSSVGGLLLLALITAVLYKLGFFKRQYKELLVEKPGEDTDTISEKNPSFEAPDLPLSS